MLPSIPKNVTEVHTALINLDTNTYKGENILLVNDNILNVICFSTNSNLEYLCSCVKIFVDGIFDTWFEKLALYSTYIFFTAK
jgi:hypothetical protein